MLFNLDFANNTILSCFFFFVIIGLYLLIPAVIAQIFHPIAELKIPIGIITKEAKTEIVFPSSNCHGQTDHVFSNTPLYF